MLFMPFQLMAQNNIVSAIKSQKAILIYPCLIERFYRENGYILAWIAPDTIKTYAWNAMLLLFSIK